METKKKGNCWTAYFDPETNRYFAEILHISREGMENYNYEITQEIYEKLGSFSHDADNEMLIAKGYSLLYILITSQAAINEK